MSMNKPNAVDPIHFMEVLRILKCVCVDIRPLWGLFGPYKETNVRLLSLRGPLRETNLCVNAKSVPGTPRIIYIPLLK